MRTYTGFWMKEEVACHYFHKSEILYRFVKDYQLNSTKGNLEMQYNYITDSVAVPQLIAHMKKHTIHNISIRGNELRIAENAHSVALHMEEKHLKFRCETLHDAEALLFPLLRTFHPYLFIIEDNMTNYGWITPILMDREYKKEQVLYSYL